MKLTHVSGAVCLMIPKWQNGLSGLHRTDHFYSSYNYNGLEKCMCFIFFECLLRFSWAGFVFSLKLYTKSASS